MGVVNSTKYPPLAGILHGLEGCARQSEESDNPYTRVGLISSTIKHEWGVYVWCLWMINSSFHGNIYYSLKNVLNAAAYHIINLLEKFH